MHAPEPSHDPQRTIDPVAEPSPQPDTVDVSQPDQRTDEGRTRPYLPTPSDVSSLGSNFPIPPIDLDRTGPYVLKQSEEAPTIPGYVVHDQLAKGGMGRVYAGYDLTLDREVAIKTLLPGADAERFITEAKITARLPHPAIPPVHALGTLVDGTPWLAMKLIHGQTLAALLKSRNRDPSRDREGAESEAASLPARLRANDLPRFIQIFEQICQAVGFAHSRGILHRDLKPLNVMVGEFGEVQVMDWGLAKDTSRDRQGAAVPSLHPSPAGRGEGGESAEHTAAGTILGTPGYMAPEQARGEVVDQRADVFALGSILAAILTGKPAFVGTSKLETIQKSASADLTDVLTRLDRCGADAELVALCKRCLAAKAEDRPENGQTVAAEVAAYRASVEARLRQAETEQAKAEMRAVEQAKRRRQFVWAAGIVLLTLTVGLAASLWQMNRAINAEQQANRNAEEAEKRLGQTQRGNQILLAVFRDLDIRDVKQGKEPLEAVLATRLVQAAREVEGEAVGDALAVATLQTQLGRTLIVLGHAREAVPLLEKAWDTRVARGGEDHPETLQTLNVLAAAYRVSGRLDKALPLLEESLRRHQEALGPEHRDTLAGLHNLAVGYRDAGKLDLALPLHEESLRRSRAKLGYDHPDALAHLNELAITLDQAGQSARALSLKEEVLQLRRDKLGPDHPDTLSSMNNLAATYDDLREFSKSLPLYEEALEKSRAKLGEDHPNTLKTLGNLAVAFCDAGQSDRAVPLYAEYFQHLRKRAKPGDAVLAGRLTAAAEKLLSCGRPQEAETYLRECLDIREKPHPDHWTTFHVQALLGAALLSQKKYADAEPLLIKGYEGMKAREQTIPPAGKKYIPKALDRLIELYTATDKPDEVEKYQELRAKYQAAKEAKKEQKEK